MSARTHSVDASQNESEIDGSPMLLIPTGSSLIPRTQAPSQGAGQTRPVNLRRRRKSDVELISRSRSFEGTTRRDSLGEVVGEKEAVESILPLSFEDEIVPLGDDVRDGASGVGLAEGDWTNEDATKNEVSPVGQKRRRRNSFVDPPPQSMHRALWYLSSASVSLVEISFQSLTLFRGGR